MDVARWLEAQCLLVVGEALAARALAMVKELSIHGFAPAPLVVCDVVVAVFAERLQVNPVRRNAGRDMIEWLRLTRRVFERDVSSAETRWARVRLLLESLMSDAPPGELSLEQRVRYESIAVLGADAPATEADVAWVSWRRRLEERLAGVHDPALGTALVQLRGSGALGFDTCDARLWQLQGDVPALRSTSIQATARQSYGEDHERFRDLRGPFEGLSSYTMPPDPMRLVASELALLGAASKASRAVLAAKLADSSLTVRFGSVELPARRRARCLLVVTLCDAVRHHHQASGQAAPEVDELREVFVNALPCLVRTFADQAFETVLEVRRDGAARSGLHRAPSVRTKGGVPLPSASTVAACVSLMVESMPWMLDDAPERAPAIAPPQSEPFDATFVVSIGGQPSWIDAVAPAVHVALVSERRGARRVLVAGAGTPRAAIDVATMAPAELGALVAEQCGKAVAREQHALDDAADATRWEGTILT